MKIAIIGYGKMGKEIERIALQRNHEIIFKFDKHNVDEFNTENLKKVDVAIEFSEPKIAYNNYLKCFEANLPVVSGTTGWLDKLPEIENLCNNSGKTFFYASNFSLGVNLFFKLNDYLAKLMSSNKDYDLDITETHHTEKKDSPSGTAITLAKGIIKNHNFYNAWSEENAENENEFPIHSLRKVKVPGIHTINYESNVDLIEITHSAKSRKGFALGAVKAAEFICGKKGFYGMDDLIKLD